MALMMRLQVKDCDSVCKTFGLQHNCQMSINPNFPSNGINLMCDCAPQYGNYRTKPYNQEIIWIDDKTCKINMKSIQGKK